MVVCLLESGDEKGRKKAVKAMQNVQGLRQKIAGQLIPLEVRILLELFVAMTVERLGLYQPYDVNRAATKATVE
jgi:hypothetical protein